MGIFLCSISKNLFVTQVTMDVAGVLVCQGDYISTKNTSNMTFVLWSIQMSASASIASDFSGRCRGLILVANPSAIN